MRSFAKSVLAFCKFYFFTPYNPFSFSFEARTNARINVRTNARIFISRLFLIGALKCIDFIVKKRYNNYATFYFYNKEFFSIVKNE